MLFPLAAMLCGCSGRDSITTMDSDEFSRAIADTSSVILVDVRTAEEYAAGHIPGAVNIDVQSRDFSGGISSLDKSKTVAVYCRGGVRSMTAARILARKGFKVYNLEGGFLSWDGPSVKQ